MTYFVRLYKVTRFVGASYQILTAVVTIVSLFRVTVDLTPYQGFPHVSNKKFIWRHPTNKLH